jgi:hypothetical protein
MKETFGEQFLHQREPRLHTSGFVEREKKRKKRKGEKVSQKPAEKIADWLKVIEKTHMGHRDDPRVLERIKRQYHKEYVIKPENIPESYYENQKRLAREQGHGDIEITDEMRDQLSEVIISDQESTLDNWVDYLSSEDSDSFPTWAKYWAFKGMVKLSTYDKEKHAFAKRKKDTVAPFPDLNREALAYVVDAVVKKINKEQVPAQAENPEFQKLLQGANFGKLYAWAIEKVTPAEESELANTKGEWIKYDQGSDHMPLVESLQGHGTGWCTAGEETAKSQLEGGDFYVYYSSDKAGKPTIPRIAIRMEQDSIAEVRGIAHEQNLDPHISETKILDDKLNEFSDGENYKKKTTDMKRLTDIEKRHKAGKELAKEDLVFLYEIDSEIQGFGYQRDPRISELRSERNPEADMPVVFDCAPEQIARDAKEINKSTKAFVGRLEPGIFKQIQKYNIEHIYTEFPEGKIRKYEIKIGAKTGEELERELKEENIYVTDWAKHLLRSKDFKTSKNIEKEKLIRLTVKDLGFPEGATTDEVYKRGQELGLELCPAEAGPHFRLQYSGKEWLLIAMEQIVDRDGAPRVFTLYWRGDRLKLHGDHAKPSDRWYPLNEFVFRASQV